MNESNEPTDRLIDQALSETLGGQSPPDLTDKILTACADAAPQPRSETMDNDSPKKRLRKPGRRLLAWAVAASVLFCLGALARPAIDSMRHHASLDLTSGTRLIYPLSSEDQQPSPYYIRDDVQFGEGEEGLAKELATASPSSDANASVTVFDNTKSLISPLYSTVHDIEGVSPAKPAKPQRRKGVTYYYADPQIDGKSTGYGILAKRPSLRFIPRKQWGNYHNAGGGRARWRRWDTTVDLKAVEELASVNRRTEDFDVGGDGLVTWKLGLQGRGAEGQGEGRGPGQGGDKYQPIYENPFLEATGIQALSTFSIDVDTASYANVRQFLTSGQLPPPDAVRLEELINYFDYQYSSPTSTDAPTPTPSPKGEGEPDLPFAAHVEVAACPWHEAHKLVRIGVKGRELKEEKRPLTNLVFLIDVSGSMQDANKLPLVIEGMKALTRQLGENDRVAIVVYASSEGLALPSTPGDQQETILAALSKLRAGGSTAGGKGIQLAYQIAEDNFIEGGVNRVILCTDGDFNVGTTSTGDLERMVVKKSKDTGVFLSVCGFGRGNLNDAMMETISNKGNGNYFYVDSQRESEKVFVKGLQGTLVTIAKDVKIQVEFNPTQVAGYRLLGYENRMLQAQDFNDDKKDAGEIGAGHTVTALYEIVPAGEPVPSPKLDELRYQKPTDPIDAEVSQEMLVLKMRWKQPDGDKSTKREWPVTDSDRAFGQASEDFRFATAAAGFGMLLRNSQYSGRLTWDAVIDIAKGADDHDPNGYRSEFLTLVKKAKSLRGEYEAKIEKQKKAKYQKALDQLEQIKQQIEKLQQQAE